MKNLTGVLAGIALILGAISAQATTISIPFTTLLGGAVSYDTTGQNVVVPGNPFTAALPLFGLGTQVIGGDGNDLSVSGNFGMVAAVEYDPAGDLAWAMANPNELVNFTIRLQDFTLVFAPNSSLTDSFKLEGLEATFGQLATWGYTEVSSGIWMDAVLDPIANRMAISIVMNGLLDPKYPSFDATLLPGPVGGPVPGYLVGSGITGDTVPESASSLLLLALGLVGLAGYGRKLKVW